LVDDASDIDPAWTRDVRTVVVTAGASAPEILVQRVVESLSAHGFHDVEELEVKQEDVRFALPAELDRASGLVGIESL
jgi:4-hydroxy-3-methylbut-2-enyl diphosphate reductase